MMSRNWLTVTRNVSRPASQHKANTSSGVSQLGTKGFSVCVYSLVERCVCVSVVFLSIPDEVSSAALPSLYQAVWSASACTFLVSSSLVSVCTFLVSSSLVCQCLYLPCTKQFGQCLYLPCIKQFGLPVSIPSLYQAVWSASVCTFLVPSSLVCQCLYLPCIKQCVVCQCLYLPCIKQCGLYLPCIKQFGLSVCVPVSVPSLYQAVWSASVCTFLVSSSLVCQCVCQCLYLPCIKQFGLQVSVPSLYQAVWSVSVCTFLVSSSLVCQFLLVVQIMQTTTECLHVLLVSKECTSL